MLSPPGMGPLALAYLFAIWMIMTGTSEIASAFALRSAVSNDIWWIILGTITLGFGLYVVLFPGLGLLALVYTIGFYALFAGISLIVLAFRFRNLTGAIPAAHPARA